MNYFCNGRGSLYNNLDLEEVPGASHWPEASDFYSVYTGIQQGSS